MDPLSVSASIAGLVTITDMIASRSYKYIKEARGASKEVKKLLQEITDLFGILNSLRLVATRYEDEAFESTMQSQHIHTCHVLLETIKGRLDKADPSQVDENKSGLRQKSSTLARSLVWPFTSTETKGLIAEIANHKANLSLALAADGMTALIQALSQQQIQGDDITEIRDNLRAQRAEQALSLLSRERRTMLDTVGNYDPARHQDIAIKLRQPGTGVWFTEGSLFTTWLATRKAKMWLYGIPGAGKTVLTSSIIQAATNQADQQTGLAFFYCDYKDSRTHDPLVIFGALVKQLAIQDPRCIAELELFYKRHCPEPGVTPIFTPEEFCSLIKSFSTYFGDVMIIIDALDECGKNRSHVVELLASLNMNEKSNIKTLFTSRLETDIEIHLHEYEKISIAATSSDLKLYVAAEIENRSRKKALRTRDPDLKKEIMDRLIDGAEGMFRWVACQLDYLCELNTDKALRRALHSLPPTLFATYERILDRVNASNSDTQELVRRVLSWIICTKRPLSTRELLEAVSISEGDTERDDDAMPDEEGILKWCSSLVRRTPDGDRLELAHFTVEEFLLAIDAMEPNSRYARYRVSPDDQDLSIAKLCLTYLEFNDFSGEVWTGKDDFNECLDNYPFFMYATIFWEQHACEFHDDIDLLHLVQSLFNPTKSSNFIHWSHYWTWAQTSDYSITRTSNTETLHFAALFAFYSSCEWLISEQGRRGDLDKLTNIGTPLYCAIAGMAVFRNDPTPSWGILTANGRPPPPPSLLSPPGAMFEYRHFSSEDRERTIKYLLDAGAAIDNIKVHPDCDWSPLAAALELDSGWKILLERGAVLDDSCLDIAEDLIEAAFSARVAEFLLAVKDDNLSGEIRARYVNVALKLEKTRQQAVKMMPKARDGSKNMLSVNNSSALSSAAMIGQTQVVKELLEHLDIDVDYRDPKLGGKTALHCACENGHLDIIKLLLDHGATIDMREDTSITPFHLAAAGKDVDVVKFLERRGADVNAITRNHFTCLHLAAKGNSVRILEYLLLSSNNTRSITEKTKHGITPLLSAVKEGSIETARFILDRVEGSEVLQSTLDGHTCLHYAARSGKERMMSLFRKSAIPPWKQTSEGLTALHYAAKGDSIAVLEGLLGIISETTPKVPNPFADAAIVSPSAFLQTHKGEWARDGFCGRRLLDMTTLSGKTALQLLISSDRFTPEKVGMFRHLISCPGIDLENRDKQHRTPLVALASRLSNTSHPDDACNLQIPIDMLLQKGVDINAQDIAGRTALHYLCSSVSFTYPIFITIGQIMNVNCSVDTLTPPPPPPSGTPPPPPPSTPVVVARKGAQPPRPPPSPLSRGPPPRPGSGFSENLARNKSTKNLRIDLLDKLKETPLQAYFRSIHRMYQKIQATDIALRFLDLASKEHLNRRLAEGDRLLNLAIVAKNDKVIKELHHLGVDAYERDHTPAFRSPLELFCIHGARDTDLLRNFISSCNDLSELDLEGKSLLHLACAYGHTNVAQELLDGGMNVNIESSDRITPIAEAVPGGYTAIVELLLDHDALVDVGATGNRGWKTCLLNRVPNVTICRLLDDRGVNDWTERTSCAFETPFLPTFSKNVSGRHFDSWVSVRIHQLTPLHYLAFESHLEVCEYVAEHVKNIDFNMQAEFGITPLFFAVLAQNSSLVKFLLAHGAKTNIVYTPTRWSMLHIAAHLGSSMLVEELLSHGADACATDISGITPSILAIQNQKLHITKSLEDAEKSQLKSRAPIAIEAEKTGISPAMTNAIVRGDLLLCQRLVERGFSIDGICKCGCTPLIRACANQHFELAVYLLGIGASVDGMTCKNKPVTRGFSPIHYAACFGNEDCLRILLEKGALASDNSHLVQPIHLAAYNGHAKIIQMLLDHANDPKKLLDSPAFANPDRIADGIILEDRMVVGNKDRSEWSYGKTIKSGRPLHFAAYMNGIEVIRVLLAAGADLEARDAKGMTAIQRTTKNNFNTAAFEVLVAAGANLNTRDNRGQTPFMRAAKVGQKLLLTKMKSCDKVDILARDRQGENALNYAFRNSNKEGAQLLVEFGLDVNGVDDMGLSAVQHSMLFRDSSFAIDHLPMVDTARSPYFGSALIVAVFCGHLDVVDLLLRRAPSTDLQQYLDLKAGIGTALYCSVLGGNLDIMTKVLDKGADIDLVGGRHGSALIAACSMGQVEMARELLRRGAALECVLPGGARIAAESAAKHHDQVQLLLERFTKNGVDGLDEPIPRKEADIVRVDEVIAELKTQQLETLPPVTTSLHSSDERNASTGSVTVIEHDDKHPIIEIREDGGE